MEPSHGSARDGRPKLRRSMDFSSTSVALSVSQSGASSLLRRLFPDVLLAHPTNATPGVPDSWIEGKSGDIGDHAASSQHSQAVECGECTALLTTSKRAVLLPERRRHWKAGRGGSLGVSMEMKSASMKSLFAAFVNDMIRRDTRIIPFGCSSLSTQALSSASDNQPTQLDESATQLVSTKNQKRVLILMSDTGGGHRASAEAIKSVFESRYGNEYKVFVIDLWKEHTPWPFNEVPNTYSFFVKHETLWRVAFHATAPRFVHQSQMAATSAFVAREVAKGLDKYQPDVIVSVHPLMQHIPLRVLRSKGMLGRIPFCTVITDLDTCHPTWFHKGVTLCFCPTSKVAQRALKAGLQSPQLRVHGLPIRPDFCRPTRPKNELRQQLGMDQYLPAVLLVGGGEGMGPVEATARALANQLAASTQNGVPDGQLVVVCGRNKRLAATLSSIEWPMPTLIKGFVTNMSEWMAACDCIITKAGPGTIAEALIKGLPMILNDYIAGQETGNVPFVVDNDAGRYSESPSEIASTVAQWFGPKLDELRRMSQNALRLARPDAVYKIVEDLDELARKRNTMDNRQLAFT